MRAPHESVRSSLVLVALASTFALSACADAPTPSADPEDGNGYEGVDEDNDPTTVMDDGKSDLPRYAIPADLPQLVKPQIIVSLDGLSVHMFDIATGFSEVYPAGVGQKNSRGKSITPLGHFHTSADTTDSWYYVARRTNPAYFGGFPFLRLADAVNSDGANTYALHGPITETLQRGFVSHGCIRMRGQDIVRVFWILKNHPSALITIQKEVEYDAKGKKVDVGKTPALWTSDEAVPYGASVGPLPAA